MDSPVNPIPDLEAIARQLDLAQAAVDNFRRDWTQSAHLLHADSSLFHHDSPLGSPDSLIPLCRWAHFPDEFTQALASALPQLRSDPALMRLLAHYQYMLFERADIFSIPWPRLPSASGPAGALFYAYVYLAAIPRTRALHAHRGIPESITVGTLADMTLWARDHYRHHAAWGMGGGWIMLHVTGRLFALGRLQYELRPYRQPFHILRHVRTREVLALAHAGGRFRPDGQFETAEATPPGCPVWVAQFEQRDGCYVGHPVSDRGQVQTAPIELPCDQWQPVLQSGDPVLSVHIPATGPMDDDACRQSFRQAVEFFVHHFPDYPFRAFVCNSWLMDPQLADHLPATSNIVRFLRRFHALPIEHACSASFFSRVFGTRNPDFATAPQDTALRRALISHARAGGTWLSSAGLLLPDEVTWQP